MLVLLLNKFIYIHSIDMNLFIIDISIYIYILDISIYIYLYFLKYRLRNLA